MLSVLFLFFLLVMDYPFLARILNERNQGEVVTKYEAVTAALQDENRDRMLEEANEYNRMLATGLAAGLSQEDRDPEEEEDKAHEEYLQLLNCSGDGLMGTVEIPKIKAVLPVYHGTSEEVLRQGAGHLEGTSLPVGGESTHACISAHRGLVGRKLFTDLDELDEGDIFLLHVLGNTLCYRVREIETVLPDEMESLEIQEGEDLVTLITCTPYGLNTHRLLVHGSRISYTEEVEQEIIEKEKALRLRDWWWLGLSAALLAFMCVIQIRSFRKKK